MTAAKYHLGGVRRLVLRATTCSTQDAINNANNAMRTMLLGEEYLHER